MVNKEHKRQYKKDWYQRNKEVEKTNCAEYRAKNPDVKKSWLKENGSRPKVRFDKAKSNVSTKTKKPWKLTFEEYERLISDPCHYCDADISKARGSGLDRLDNSKGYEVGNVVPCCKACNTGRNANFTHDEWMVAVKAVLEFRKQL